MAVIHKLPPSMRRNISGCSREIKAGDAPDPLHRDKVALHPPVCSMVGVMVRRLGSGMVVDIGDRRSPLQMTSRMATPDF